jgi:hypothetical protein
MLNIYQLDTSGNSPNNRIIQENHTLNGLRVRTICPLVTPFFSESVSVIDNRNNRVLSKGEYNFYSIESLASAMYGKEIYNLILIRNRDVSDNVSITYQTLGGDYVNNSSKTKGLIDCIYSDNRPVNWFNIIDVPSEFTPSLHLHSMGDSIGYEYLVAAIDRLNHTLSIANSLRDDRILKYIDDTVNSTR